MKSTNAAYPSFAYVGCFSAGKNNGHGTGISVYRVDQSTGTWTLIQVADSLPSPGFLALDRQNDFLYVAHGDGAEISAYSIDRATGRLQLRNRQASGGKNGVHLDVDPGNRYVALANGNGVVTLFPINKDGSLAPYTDCSRYEGAFHHQVLFDPTSRFLLAPNHGSNKMHVFQFDAARGKLIKNDPPTMDRPAGPRHLAFHPTKAWAYDVNRNSTVIAYRWNPEYGTLEAFQEISTVPTTFKGNNAGCEIAFAPTGKFLYVSNRGHDSVAIFAVDPNTGILKADAWEPTQGRHPRFFAFDANGGFLSVTNLESDCIVMFKVNSETGQLTPTGQVVEVGSPSCIAFAYYLLIGGPKATSRWSR